MLVWRRVTYDLSISYNMIRTLILTGSPPDHPQLMSVVAFAYPERPRLRHVLTLASLESCFEV